MSRLLAIVAVTLTLVLCAPAPAHAAYSYAQGETVALSVSGLSSAYTVHWFSDRDGFISSGNPLRTSSLSVGAHELTYLIYRNATRSLVYRGTVDVEVVAPPPPTARAAPAPGGAVAPGEFEPVGELLLGTPDTYSVEDLYPAILEGVRGAVSTRIYVDNRYVEYELRDLFARTGVDDTDHTFYVTPLDSIWIRDYGPLFTKAGGDLEVVDLDYYPERPNDDVLPALVGREKGLAVRPLGLSWEGGNFTSDGAGNLFTTDVLLARNWGSDAQITGAAEGAFHGRLHVLEHMLDDGGTGHLDMFALMTGPRSVLVNRFARGHQNARRMDGNAARLESLGYDVTRIDLADTGFSSYTNAVLVNGVALVPTYGRSSTDSRALAAYRAAGYRTVGIDSRRIIEWSGAIHCITITVPR